MRKPWWQHEAAIAWALILFFPLGLLLMWRYASWRNQFKWLWTAVTAIVVLYFVAAAISAAIQETDNSSTNAGVSAGLGEETEPTASATPLGREVIGAEPTAVSNPTLPPDPTATPKPPKPTSTPKPQRIAPATAGSVAESQGVRVTINEIADDIRWSNAPPPPTGKRIVAFDLTVEYVKGGGTYSVSPGDFHLVDKDSFAYTVGLQPVPALTWIDLREGEKTRGWISFEVNQNAMLRTLTYVSYLDKTIAEFTFD